MNITTKLLRSQTAFSVLSESELQQICDAGTIQQYSKGEYLIREGSMNHSLFLITSGSVHIKSYGVKVAKVSSGNLIGEVSAAGLSAPIADVTAADSVTAFKFPVEVIHKLATVNPTFEAHLHDIAMSRVLR
jgi:signal-transduction protein with cAMP-binding, CBS, and nucleotidyltransferase domain